MAATTVAIADAVNVQRHRRSQSIHGSTAAAMSAAAAGPFAATPSATPTPATTLQASRRAVELGARSTARNSAIAASATPRASVTSMRDERAYVIVSGESTSAAQASSPVPGETRRRTNARSSAAVAREERPDRRRVAPGVTAPDHADAASVAQAGSGIAP